MLKTSAESTSRDAPADLWEHAARRFEPKVRRWATPGLMAVELDPLTRQTPALDVVDAAIVDTIDNPAASNKVIICMSPQEGKSQRVTRRSPLWMLQHDPTLRIVIVSYDHDTAVRWGRQIKRDIEENPDLGLTVRADSKAAGRWETEQGGSLICVSINGAFTGKPADVLIIDDPVKDRAAAESALQRDRVWDFWENVAKVRSHKVILVLTRWHADDLAGRLLKKEPGDWRLVSIPAIAEDEDDPLGRKPGEEMQSAQSETVRPPGYFRKMMASASSYVWLSLFQQRPTLAEGNLFKRGDWRYWELAGEGQIKLGLSEDGAGRGLFRLNECFRFITVDLAISKKTSADFTVASAWAITPDGDMALLDRARERVAKDDHFALVEPLRQRWLGPYDVVHVEATQHSTTLVYAAGSAGIPTAPLDADADKLTRALPYAALVRQHRVYLPRNAVWLPEWQDEHADFPNTKHDDQVDTGAYAGRVAVTHWLPPEDSNVIEQRRIRELQGSRSEPEEIDLMSATW